jgi:hypothetical protein
LNPAQHPVVASHIRSPLQAVDHRECIGEAGQAPLQNVAGIATWCWSCSPWSPEYTISARTRERIGRLQAVHSGVKATGCSILQLADTVCQPFLHTVAHRQVCKQVSRVKAAWYASLQLTGIVRQPFGIERIKHALGKVVD